MKFTDRKYFGKRCFLKICAADTKQHGFVGNGGGKGVNSLKIEQILDWPKLKIFADDKIDQF